MGWIPGMRGPKRPCMGGEGMQNPLKGSDRKLHALWGVGCVCLSALRNRRAERQRSREGADRPPPSTTLLHPDAAEHLQCA